MKQFSINTIKYLNEVLEFIENKNIKINSVTSSPKSFTINYNFLVIRDLTLLIEDIVLNSNPIVKNSNKIKEVVRVAIFEKNRNKINEDLYNTINKASALSIDGYIDFKLQWHVNEINNILYYLVKKSFY
jgi:hypothetical protein